MPRPLKINCFYCDSELPEFTPGGPVQDQDNRVFRVRSGPDEDVLRHVNKIKFPDGEKEDEALLKKICGIICEERGCLCVECARMFREALDESFAWLIESVARQKRRRADRLEKTQGAQTEKKHTARASLRESWSKLKGGK